MHADVPMPEFPGSNQPHPRAAVRTYCPNHPAVMRAAIVLRRSENVFTIPNRAVGLLPPTNLPGIAKKGRRYS